MYIANRWQHEQNYGNEIGFNKSGFAEVQLECVLRGDVTAAFEEFSFLTTQDM